jgi:DNA-binding CsgD family transcriptional regulator
VNQLTNRQKQILNLLADGSSNTQIAASIGISEHTVKVHLWRLFKRYEVNNRTEAAMKWRAEPKNNKAVQAFDILNEALQKAIIYTSKSSAAKVLNAELIILQHRAINMMDKGTIV